MKYIVGTAPVVVSELPGMKEFAKQVCAHSDKSLWNNGTYIMRDVRNKPGVVSNHARSLALDASYRFSKVKGRKNGREVSLPYIYKLLVHADTLGIQLVIDYALQRSWKCDRRTWIKIGVEIGDWYHIELSPNFANDPIRVKASWDTVFGASPITAPPLV